MSSPAIIHKVKFVTSNSKKFQSYIDYIDRDEATRNYHFTDYSLYNNYMDNPLKSGTLFTSDKDFLLAEEKEELKQKFTEAQKNKSLMWQDVFSFDNKFLEEIGAYDPKTKILNEKLLREAVRNAMNDLIKKENMSPSFLWSASFHYNTDNIHVHVASVEVNPTRQNWERGKRKFKTMYSMKSKFANTIINRSKEYENINLIIRENLINDIDKSIYKDKEVKYLLKMAIKNLPSDKKQWQYGYNSMTKTNVYLDKITKYYLENYKNNEMKELQEMFNKEAALSENLYGKGKNSFYKQYEINKMKDTYKRLGNCHIGVIKEIIKNQKLNDSKIIISNKDLYKLKNAFKKEFNKIKNEMTFEELQRQIEYENNSITLE